jgi:hypothetical protein
MKKIFLIIAVISIAFASCSKEGEPRQVKYFIKGLSDPFKIVYQTENGMVTDSVDLVGNTTEWSYSFEAEQGDITYMYIESKENLDNTMNAFIGIMIDNQVFRQSKNWDGTKGPNNDIYYSLQRGTIPFLD